MLFQRDKQLKQQQSHTLPFIFKKPQQEPNQSSKSLYKSDSESSHLTINPQSYQLHYDKSIHQTLNVKNSFASNDAQNTLSIKKYLKKGEEFNKINSKKIYRINNNTQQNAINNLNNQMYRLPKQFSINRLENQIDWRERSEEKGVQRIYVSQNKEKQKRNNLKIAEIYKSKNQEKRSANLSKLSSQKPKTMKNLVSQEVQTQKIVQQKVLPKRNKKLTKQTLDSSLKTPTTKINTFQTLQKIPNPNTQSRFATNQTDIKKKSKFINLSSILQKDEQQPQPPKKLNSVRHNNIQTKYILNQSFTGQQSTAPSLYANSYLDSMSKLSYNITGDIQKLRKRNRYDVNSAYYTTEQRYSKQQQQTPTTLTSTTNINNPIALSNTKASNKKTKPTIVNPQQHQSQTSPQKLLNIKNQTAPFNQYQQHQSSKSISLSIVPEMTETNQQHTQYNNYNMNQKSHKHHSHKHQKNQDDRQFSNNLKSIEEEIRNRQFDNEGNNGNQDEGQLNMNQNKNGYYYGNNSQEQNSEFQRRNNDYNPSRKNNKRTNKPKNVDQMMQFPQVTEIKISNTIVHQSQLMQHNHNKLIHPIRNNFNQNQASWIMNGYTAKSKILEKINFQTFQIKKYRNGVYFGQLVDGKKQGHGIIFYFNGKLYQGEFKNDLKNGTGYEEFPDGSKYQGEFSQGIKNGKGTFQWANGEVYQGQWKQGKKHGSGIWKSQNGQSYLGEWNNGQVQGFGVYISKNGDRYQGQFKNSQKQGLGTERYHNGQTYVGQYRKNRPNGIGQYFWNNGNYYKGDFINHLRHGQGYFKNLKNNQQYQGQYRNDKKCGYGQLIVTNGQITTTYVGNFENDYKHGYGEVYQNDECKFKGYWVNGKLLEEEEEDQESGEFRNDKQKTNQHSISVISQKPQLINRIKNNNRSNNNNSNKQQQSFSQNSYNNNRSTPINQNNPSVNPRFNKLIVPSTINSRNDQNSITSNKNNRGLNKSISPHQNKSIQSGGQNSLDNSNYKRACGCARKH